MIGFTAVLTWGQLTGGLAGHSHLVLETTAWPPTVILLMAGFAMFHWSIAVACLLIMGGAVLAAKDMILRRAAS